MFLTREAAVAPTASLILEIDSATPLKWSGNQEYSGGSFIPVRDEFEVEGGSGDDWLLERNNGKYFRKLTKHGDLSLLWSD